MPQQSPVTVQLAEGTLSRLSEFARRQQRGDSEIIEEAIINYLDYMNRFEKEVQKGLDAANAGHLTSHEKLKESLRGMGLDLD